MTYASSFKLEASLPEVGFTWRNTTTSTPARLQHCCHSALEWVAATECLHLLLSLSYIVVRAIDTCPLQSSRVAPYLSECWHLSASFRDQVRPHPPGTTIRAGHEQP